VCGPDSHRVNGRNGLKRREVPSVSMYQRAIYLELDARATFSAYPASNTFSVAELDMLN
jgi:hypothetical protein